MKGSLRVHCHMVLRTHRTSRLIGAYSFAVSPPFGWLRKGIHRDSRRRNSDACTAHTDIFTWRMKITGNTISTLPAADNYEVPDSVMYSPFSYSRRPNTSQISSGNAASKPSCGTLLRQHCVQCSFYLTNLYGKWLFYSPSYLQTF